MIESQQHFVLAPDGSVYTQHQYAGSCLEMAVAKFNPRARQMQPRSRRQVWLEMKERGYRIVRPTDQPDGNPL